MLPIVLITGESVTWRWLLLIPAVALQTMFCLGLACIVARIGAKVPDTSQVLPFLLRTWLYISGVFYSVNSFAKGHGRWVHIVLEVNPGSVFVELFRGALLSHQPSAALQWWLASGWAVGILVIGYVYFWQAEEQYGRE
jgi:teichoic acid transport system permease protein